MSPLKIEESKVALRELGLDDDVITRLPCIYMSVLVVGIDLSPPPPLNK